MDTGNAENVSNPDSKWMKYFYTSLIAISILSGAMSSYILYPIYPQEAAVKGIPASQFGFVFGVFQLVYCFMSPIYGIYSKAIGPPLLFKVGMFVLSVATISFGFVNRLPAGAPFLATSIVIRIISGMAEAAAFNAGYVLVIGYYPTDAAIAVSIIESSYVAGMIVGPTIGTLLYAADGFRLPFLVLGGVLMLLFLTSVCVLRAYSNAQCDEVDSSSDGPKVLKTLFRPRVSITCFVLFATAISAGFTQGLLEVHISSLNLSETSIGLMFIATTMSYIVSSFICARLSNRIAHLNVMIIVGLVIMAVGIVITGPAPFIPLPLSVGLVASSLVAIGAGYGCLTINTFMELQNNIAGDGPKNVATNGLTSGLHTSLISFGFFFGPTVGGPLYDSLGFPMACMVFLGLDLLAIIAVFLVVVSNCVRKA